MGKHTSMGSSWKRWSSEGTLTIRSAPCRYRSNHRLYVQCKQASRLKRAGVLLPGLLAALARLTGSACMT